MAGRERQVGSAWESPAGPRRPAGDSGSHFSIPREGEPAAIDALAHRHRLSILRALVQSDVPLSVPQLRVRVSGPATVLEHLGTLRSAGFVEMVGQGRASKWRVVPGSLDKAAALIASDPQ
ncbi:winged helix-turn-helix domain-containing protein [Calidifontibacter indicus]|uniref:winged helix-turn-helix domain-containing protein n=1 Tax=Calidifontibacter indicus TaxID=419650 RepID=UPI003D70BB11